MPHVRHLAIIAATLLTVAPALADSKFDEVVKKVEARIEPAKARRGQAVTWTLTIKLADEWHTYPTKQVDPGAESFTNRIRFAPPAEVVFAGELTEPAGVQKDEEGIKVTMVEGEGVWKRTLVVRPDAKPGKIKVPVKITVLVCSKVCLAPQTITTEAELTITDEPPVEVDPQYRKALDEPRK